MFISVIENPPKVDIQLSRATITLRLISSKGARPVYNKGAYIASRDALLDHVVFSIEVLKHKPSHKGEFSVVGGWVALPRRYDVADVFAQAHGRHHARDLHLG